MVEVSTIHTHTTLPVPSTLSLNIAPVSVYEVPSITVIGVDPFKVIVGRVVSTSARNHTWWSVSSDPSPTKSSTSHLLPSQRIHQ